MDMDTTSLVLFTDVMQLANWAEATEIFAHVNEFLPAFRFGSAPVI